MRLTFGAEAHRHSKQPIYTFNLLDGNINNNNNFIRQKVKIYLTLGTS